MRRLTYRDSQGNAKPVLANDSGEAASIEALCAKLAAYEDAEDEGRLHIIPDIKKGKTLYWIWSGEIMPVEYRGISGGCYDRKNGIFHVVHEMRTKKDRTLILTRNRKPREYICKAGDKRMLYTEDLGESVFFNRRDAEAALKSQIH